MVFRHSIRPACAGFCEIEAWRERDVDVKQRVSRSAISRPLVFKSVPKCFPTEDFSPRAKHVLRESRQSDSNRRPADYKSAALYQLSHTGENPLKKACPLILLDNRCKGVASSHGWRDVEGLRR